MGKSRARESMEQGKAEKKAEAERPAVAIPERSYYKIGEVCEITDTQPYVLRFWETEFPQLSPRKSRAGQRIYTRKDVDLILKIKRLLYDEEYTIAGARKHLEEESGPGAGAAVETPRPPPKKKKAEASHASAAPPESERPLARSLRTLRQELRALKDLLES